MSVLLRVGFSLGFRVSRASLKGSIEGFVVSKDPNECC